MTFLDVAVIGCGAISEKAHLPAAAKVPSIRVTALVDANRARAQELAASYGITQIAESFDALPEPPQAAIVALPHHCHAPVATRLLTRGVHVLVEKPMALSLAEGHRMLRAADSGRAEGLTVGMVRRFFYRNCVLENRSSLQACWAKCLLSTFAKAGCTTGHR